MNKTWLIINVKQQLWSTWFGSPIFAKGGLIDHSAVVQRQSRLRWTNRWDVILGMVKIEEYNVPRCYKPCGFGQIAEYTFHYFPDISETGYGQTSYLRMINENEDVHSCLMVGKPWVAPVKHVTIPRLEMTAAILSVNVSEMLRKDICCIRVVFNISGQRIEIG